MDDLESNVGMRIGSVDKEKVKRERFGSGWDWFPFIGMITVGDRYFGKRGEKKSESISSREMRDVERKMIFHYLVDPTLAIVAIPAIGYVLNMVGNYIKS